MLQNEIVRHAHLAHPHEPHLAHHRLKVLLSLATLYLIWGSAFLAIRIAIRDIPPFLMTGSRFMIAGVLLYGYLRWSGAPAPTRKQWITTGWISLIMVSISNGAMVWSELYVDSGVAAVFLATSPIWTALFAGIFERWPSRLESVGLGLGFFGVVMLNINGGLHAHPAAAAALLLASSSWALGSILSRHVELPGGMMTSATQMLAGAPVLILGGLLAGERIHGIPSPGPLVAYLYLGLVSSLFGYSAYTYLIHNTRPALAMSYSYVNPAVAVALGAIYAGEKIDRIEIVAIVATVAAVVFIMQGRALERHQAARPHDAFSIGKANSVGLEK